MYIVPAQQTSEWDIQQRIVTKGPEPPSLCDAVEAQLQSTECTNTALLSAAVAALLKSKAALKGEGD